MSDTAWHDLNEFFDGLFETEESKYEEDEVGFCEWVTESSEDIDECAMHMEYMQENPIQYIWESFETLGLLLISTSGGQVVLTITLFITTLIAYHLYQNTGRRGRGIDPSEIEVDSDDF